MACRWSGSVSRRRASARQPAAVGAIIGNSTVQLIDPARLTALSRLPFVSLAVAGTGPIEQLAVADWYLRHHPGDTGQRVRAIVFGLDQTWCQSDGRLDVTNPFPFWLYSPGIVDYIVNLMRMKTFEIAERKLKIVLGRGRPLRADGYRDYDSGRNGETPVANELVLPADDSPLPERVDFAAVPRLRAFLAGLPAEAAAVLLFPPRHLNGLPAPGSGAAALLGRCKTAYREVAASRPRTAVVDLAVEGQIARDDRLFWDRVHYRQPVARLVEDAIAAAIAPSRRRGIRAIPIAYRVRGERIELADLRNSRHGRTFAGEAEI